MYYTQQFQRSVHQPAIMVGALGAMIFAACPPLGLPVMIIGWLMHRRFSRARKAHAMAAVRRARERQEQARIIAVKSLRL